MEDFKLDEYWEVWVIDVVKMSESSVESKGVGEVVVLGEGGVVSYDVGDSRLRSRECRRLRFDNNV